MWDIREEEPLYFIYLYFFLFWLTDANSSCIPRNVYKTNHARCRGFVCKINFTGFSSTCRKTSLLFSQLASKRTAMHQYKYIRLYKGVYVSFLRVIVFVKKRCRITVIDKIYCQVFLVCFFICFQYLMPRMVSL